MGKKLIIKGADFSANSVGKDVLWETIAQGTWTATASTAAKVTHLGLNLNIPSGTLTRLTVTTGTQASNQGTATGALDRNGNELSLYWIDHIIAGSNVTVSGERITDTTITDIIVWVNTVGQTLQYTLEGAY